MQNNQTVIDTTIQVAEKLIKLHAENPVKLNAELNALVHDTIQTQVIPEYDKMHMLEWDAKSKARSRAKTVFYRDDLEDIAAAFENSATNFKANVMMQTGYARDRWFTVEYAILNAENPEVIGVLSDGQSIVDIICSILDVFAEKIQNKALNTAA